MEPLPVSFANPEIHGGWVGWGGPGMENEMAGMENGVENSKPA